ncbi:MAG: SIS domain-containing protein [Anaerolineaceae bacterium]|nr:SIS domain-containing protein [Anaerolineaceae bacterium]
MLHIEREIAEQPALIGNLLDRESETAGKIANAIREFDPTFIHIAARGTSDNAARYAQYAFGIHAHLPVALATPSIHTLYETTPKLSRALVIGISQSGKSEDVCKVITDAREQGALTVAITNAPESPLAQAAQFHLNVMTGPELSVAATKTYTAQLTAIAMLMTALVDEAELTDSLNRLPDFISETLSLSDDIATWAQRYRYMERLVTIGRGYNYCTAFEISLKIKELCYISGEGYSEADFRHGPFALIDPGFPVFVIAPSGKTLPTLTDFVSKLAERQAETLIISNDPFLLSQGQKKMPLPASLPEWLSPVAAVIPGQIFAMQLALEKGHAVDAPRGLNKVTVTR